MKAPMSSKAADSDRLDASLGTIAKDLDVMARLAVDSRVAARLRTARSAAVRRLGRHSTRVSSHWMNGAPVGLVLMLLVFTSWSLLTDSGHSLDAEILADSLPVDAYLDSDLEASIELGDVRLLEN